MQVGMNVKCMYTSFGWCGYSNFGDIATFKTANFPFLTMGYSPWSSKNSIDRNRLKKFMQVGMNIKCMYTNFGVCGYSDFGDIATFKNANFPFQTMGYSPWSSKNSKDWNWLKKFMQVGMDV